VLGRRALPRRPVPFIRKRHLNGQAAEPKKPTHFSFDPPGPAVHNIPPLNDDRGRVQKPAATIQAYAKMAGVLLLLSIIAGGFSEAYVPSRLIVSSDATATAKNIMAFEGLFRLSFAIYLLEAVCDIALSLVFYVLLRPVHRDIALLAAFFGLVSTALFGVAELFYFTASLPLGGAGYLKTFSPDQLNTLALLLLKMYGYGGVLFMVFYGIASILRGYLIIRSGYLPPTLGGLLAVAGVGFIAKDLALVLAPVYASNVFLVPMLLANVSLMLWLFVKGVDIPKWVAKSAASEIIP
jgi:hypothetical protein